MVAEHQFKVVDESEAPVDDTQLEALLRDVYVGGGFTAPDVAATVFSAGAVRARGRLLCARDEHGGLVGTVIVVPPDSSARQLALPEQAEMHLLAVSPDRRRDGVGAMLVQAAMTTARAEGYRSMVLWTQPAMHSAHRLYARAGFSRSPTEDFERGGRVFLVYRAAL